MIKVLMLDFNGVTGLWNGKVLASNLKANYGISDQLIKDIEALENQEFIDFEEGRISVEKYENFLSKEGEQESPLKTYKECLKGIFSDNPKMIEAMKELKGKIKIVCGQNGNRFDYNVQKELESFQIFEEVFYSSDFGSYKNKDTYFKKAIKKLGVKPEEILFFDDAKTNIEVAKSIGIDAHLFTNVDEFKRVLKKKLKNN